MSHLEITEKVLAYCNTISNNNQRNSRVLYTLFQITHLVNY